MILDISPPITPDLAVWPGDTPPSREVLLDMERGDTITLSTLRATVHLGAHADAASHYGRHAPAIEGRRLEDFLGPCQVIRIDIPPGGLVTRDHLTVPVEAERVLIATGTYPDPRTFSRDFAACHTSLIDHLHRSGVRLIGIDTPSVDPCDSQDLPAHQSLLHNEMAVLEGLRLDHVPPGLYELIALPLPLVGCHASPVRAALRELPAPNNKPNNATPA